MGSDLTIQSSATWQIFLVSLIGFCCPGMLNALNGMGGGGILIVSLTIPFPFTVDRRLYGVCIAER